MKVDFQNIEEGQNGKLFAVLEEDQLPVGQLFYKVDNNNKNLIVDYIYIPRKYWREGGIREQLIAELQSMYPAYSFSMKQNQKQSYLLKEAPARSKAQFRYMQGICNGSIEPPKGMTRAKACEYVEGQKNYKSLPDKKSARPSIRDTKGSEFLRDIIAEYVGGESVASLAKKYNVSTNAIKNYLQENNIPSRSLKEHRLHPKTKKQTPPIRERVPNRKQKKLLVPKKQRPDTLPNFKFKTDHDLLIDELPQELQDEINERKKLEESGEVPFIPQMNWASPYSGDYVPSASEILGDKKMKPKEKYRSEKIAKSTLHKNVHTGKPCTCGFYRPEQKQSKWKQVTASKLDKIIKDDPKVLRTEEGQKVLDWMKGLPEKVDDFLPWIVREYKKKRLEPSMVGEGEDAFVELMQTTPIEGTEFRGFLDEATLSHWADWYGSNSPTRRGVNIMEFSVKDIFDKIQEWDLELLSQGVSLDEEKKKDEKIIYEWPDGWFIRDLSPEECDYEGQTMQHCVRRQGYGDRIEQGLIKIVSLRSPNNKPHATLEINKDGSIQQIQGKQNLHPLAKYRKRIRQFMTDPNGFERLFNKKPTLPGGRNITEWQEFRNMDGESNYDPSMIAIDEEEEFDSKYDENMRRHPYAGPGGFDRNYRPEHYGIYPPEASPDKPVDMARLLTSLPEDISQEDLQKLLDYARRTGQVDQLAKIMQSQQTRNQDLLIIPSFEDQRRGGWRDAFEKMTMTNPNDPNYKEKWNEWLSSIWSEDPKQLAKNLVEVNKINQNWGESGSEDESRATSILKIINKYNSMNQLRSMFNPEEDELLNWSEFDETDFSDYRQRFERGLHKGEGISQLPTRVDEQQLSLLSKWRRTSKWKKTSVDNWDDIENEEHEEHTQEEAKWEGQAAAMYNLSIVPNFMQSQSISGYGGLYREVGAASKTQDFYDNFIDRASEYLIDIFAGSEESWVLDEEYQDSFYDGFWEETNKNWQNYIEALKYDIKKNLQDEPIYEAIIKDWPWQEEGAIESFQNTIEKTKELGLGHLLWIFERYYSEIYDKAELMYANDPNFAWIKGELDKQIREVINNADEIIAQGLGASNPDYSADMSKWYAEPVSKREEVLLGPEETDENEARKHRKNIRDKWKVQPGKKLEWATEEDFPKKRWE